MQPRTLLAMAGVQPAPARLSDAALIIIDAQNEYVDGLLALPDIGPALQATAELLRRARATASPIVHVAHRGQPGGAFAPDTHGAQIAEPVQPNDGERIVFKRLPNAFAGTDLLQVLQDLGKNEIIMAGFMTHMCVESTARAAIDLGLKPTVVAAATATRPLPNPLNGTILPAAEVQRNALTAMADRFATIVRDVRAIAD